MKKEQFVSDASTEYGCLWRLHRVWLFVTPPPCVADRWTTWHWAGGLEDRASISERNPVAPPKLQVHFAVS